MGAKMRDVDTPKGMYGVKTMGSSKKSAISRVKSSTYLDLYMMEKEKERLEKESLRLDIRHNQVKSRLKEIAEYRETVSGDKVKRASVPLAEEEAPPKVWKKVSMQY
jgi:hypothetical protein